MPFINFYIYRCIVGFLFTFVGIVGKTMLTVGMHDTMHQFMDKDMNEYWEMVSNDTFLKESLIRGILSTMFLVLGWTTIGLVAKTAIFSFTNVGELFGIDLSSSQNSRRRRHAQHKTIQNVIFDANPFDHIERSFPSLTTHNPSLNDYLIQRSFKTIQKHQTFKPLKTFKNVLKNQNRTS